MKAYHFIGIGGIGMSALARILLQRGYPVSGSDQAASPLVESLKKEGAKITIGHFASTISEPVIVIYNSQVPKENPEYQEAQKRGYPIWHRSDLLRVLMEGYLPLLVAGTHGKTTTSSLLAHILCESGLSPSFAIGGIVHNLGTNGSNGSGRFFVAEADESDGTFLKYHGHGGIITNIDNDHLDYWETEGKLESGFYQFAEQIPDTDLRFICVDDERLAALKIRGVKYGFHKKADLRVLSFRQEGWQLFFDVEFERKEYTDIALPLIGGHNVLNAAAVFGLCLRLGIEEKKISKAMSCFLGVGRRAEKKGEWGKISCYDDYAHHPTEIFATLRALKKAVGERRLVVAFQPHRFTRTKDCMDLFPDVFEAADELILTDIYAAGEKPLEGITTDALLKKIRMKSTHAPRYFPRQDLVEGISSLLHEGDVLITMGAGDITKVGPQVIEKLRSCVKT
jgi:UDP-N-acetylmuramate--alanine ligase